MQCLRIAKEIPFKNQVNSSKLDDGEHRDESLINDKALELEDLKAGNGEDGVSALNPNAVGWDRRENT